MIEGQGKTVFGLFGNKTQREVKRLNKDAPNMVDYTNQCFRGERVREIAVETRRHLERAYAVYGTANIDLRRAIAEHETFHREARRNNNQVKLTAYTLSLIYLRAEVQGDPCAQARAAIDDFMEAWVHAPETDNEADGNE